MKSALKLILSIILLSASSIAKSEEPVVTLSTTIPYQGSYTSSYDQEFQLTDHGLTWTAKCFSNNNSAWNNIRCGSKSSATTATITTDFTISEPIARVEVEITRYKAGSTNRMNSMSLLVSSDADMSRPSVYTADITTLPTAAGESSTITIDLPETASNLYYQLSISMPKVSSEGVFSVNSIKYFAPSPEEVPGVHLATLSFTTEDDLLPHYVGDMTIAPGGEYSASATNNLDGADFIAGDAIISLAKADGTIQPRWWESKTISPELRLNPDNTMTISMANDDCRLIKVKFLQGNSAESYFNAIDATAVTNLGSASFANQTWTADPSTRVNQLTLTFKDYCRCGAIDITYVNERESIASITVTPADSDSPAEYYNLQGIRVTNLTPGLYIVRRGNVTTKEFIK
ncbi:MAG: hypothetical protein HDS53_06480 [Barnesiella sp.]|nr:hypothetical protein [Barnesiella sp.]